MKQHLITAGIAAGITVGLMLAAKHVAPVGKVLR